MTAEIDRLRETMEHAQGVVRRARAELKAAQEREAEAEENWATEVALAEGFHVGQVVRSKHNNHLWRIEVFRAQRSSYQPHAPMTPYARSLRLRKDGTESLLGHRNLSLLTIEPAPEMEPEVTA